MGLGLSKNHGDRNPENNVELANTMETEQTLEPELSPVNEQLQSQEPGPSPGIEQLQNQETSEQTQILEPEQSPETGRLYFRQCVRLHKAALQGNWKNAKKSIRERPDLANIPITEGGETALHLAAAGRSVDFVARLLGKMEESSVRKPNSKGQTAFCYAAIGGNVKIAKKMLEKDEYLIRREGFRPLYYAAWQGNKDMANYLFKESIQQSNGPVSPARPEGDQIAVGEDQNSVTKVFHSWLEQDQVAVLLKCIHSGLYDLAVKMLKEKKELAIAEENGETALITLARKPLAFSRTRGRGFWDNICSTVLCYVNRDSSFDDPYELLDALWEEVIRREDVESDRLGERFKALLFIAAESENDGFLIELIRQYPDFIYKFNAVEHTIFHIAVLHRSVDVFNLLYELNGVKDLMISFIDNVGNNILHLAAMLPHQNKLNTIPGAALQMQREVLWYKEVEKVVPANYITMKNDEDETPHEMFPKEHEILMKEGEKQIKQIAKACMLVTTLITTIVFTTVFTVPGGYNNKGAPILQHKEFFMVLPISQAIGTLSSLFSMLMFLSVLSSRFSENDFLTSLPLWLVLGVTSLFLSIVAMMVAFCRCLIFYEPGFVVKVALLVPFAIVPIIFLILKFHLFFTIFRCTYSSTWLFRSNNRLFS